MAGRDVVEIDVGGRAVDLPGDVPLSLALHDAGLPVESPCGGRGRCGKCRVLFLSEAPDPTPEEHELITERDLTLGFRLSCRHTAMTGARLALLSQGLAADVAADRKSSLKEGKSGAVVSATVTSSAYPLAPLVRKVPLTLPPPVAGDDRGDWERLLDALIAAWPEGDAAFPLAESVGIGLLRDLPDRLRGAGFEVTAVVGEGRVLAVEPGDTSDSLYGVALDIGTTTLAAVLVDLRDGSRVAVASAANPQLVRGADLMSRLRHAFTPEGRRDLRERVTGVLNGLIADVRRRAGVKAEDVYAAVAVGNTAMHHLFLGLEVEQLGLAPYVPTVTSPLVVTAAEAGLEINPAGILYCPPIIAGFAGADLSAVLLATRLWERDGPRLVVDLGTNGEILLGDRKGILACSAPAGPAFEGGAISRGMRAAPGAIQGLRINGEVVLDVIGRVTASGICGSGLVEAAAELLRIGVLDRSGRLQFDKEGLPPGLRRRLRGDNGGAFVLAEDGKGESVTLTQKDVRQLQLAKAAIRAGAEILLTRRGIGADDLCEVLLAGTFGNYVDGVRAVAIGLLPPVESSLVRPIGNAAMTGAVLALASEPARRAMERAVRAVEHVTLATLPEFQDVFLRSTFFPSDR